MHRHILHMKTCRTECIGNKKQIEQLFLSKILGWGHQHWRKMSPHMTLNEHSLKSEVRLKAANWNHSPAFPWQHAPYMTPLTRLDSFISFTHLFISFDSCKACCLTTKSFHLNKLNWDVFMSSRIKYALQIVALQW